MTDEIKFLSFEENKAVTPNALRVELSTIGRELASLDKVNSVETVFLEYYKNEKSPYCEIRLHIDLKPYANKEKIQDKLMGLMNQKFPTSSSFNTHRKVLTLTIVTPVVGLVVELYTYGNWGFDKNGLWGLLSYYSKAVNDSKRILLTNNSKIKGLSKTEVNELFKKVDETLKRIAKFTPCTVKNYIKDVNKLSFSATLHKFKEIEEIELIYDLGEWRGYTALSMFYEEMFNN